MTEPVTPRQFLEAVGVEDWRVVGEGACAYFCTGSFAAGARLVQAISEQAEVDGHAPDVDVRHEGVTVRLATVMPDYYGLSNHDVTLARRISAVARELGVAANPAAIQTVQIMIHAHDDHGIRPFWRAVLGYRDRGPKELRDPLGREPAVCLRQLCAPFSQRSRTTVAIWVPSDQAEARVAAALGACGRMVTDEHAPWLWVLADYEGNEIYVFSFIDRYGNPQPM